MTGDQLKIEGLERVAKNNEDWLREMRHFAFLCYNEFGTVSTDELRRYADDIDWHPGHSNAWGAVFKQRGWKAAGWKKSKYPSNHARMIRVWRWVG